MAYSWSDAVRRRLLPVGFLMAIAVYPSAARASLTSIRVIDYAPANQSVTAEWWDWQPALIQTDLNKLAALHANVVRVYAPKDACFPSLCGWSQNELAAFVAMARAAGLRVWLLLPVWGPYTPASAGQTYAKAVMAQFAGRTDEIAALEVFSEILPLNMPLGWQDWVRAVMPVARRAAGGIPVTVSAGGGDTANTNFSELVHGLNGTSGQPDFYDYHFYYNPADTVTDLAAARAIAGSVPMMVGETGKPSDCHAALFGGCTWKVEAMIACGGKAYPKWISGGWAAESAQSTYIGEVEQGTLASGLGAAGIWTLYDHAQSCSNLWGPTLFGLFRPDGSAKPAAWTVTQAFIAAGG